MCAWLDFLRKKWLCWRDGKGGCANCKHCANDFDFVGCSLFLASKKRRKL